MSSIPFVSLFTFFFFNFGPGSSPKQDNYTNHVKHEVQQNPYILIFS